MQIRTLKSSDYDKVYDMWIHTPGMGLNDIDDSKEGMDRFLNRNPNTCFAATEGDQIQGVILTGHDGRRGYIYHTAVDVNARRRGIGKALVEIALNALKEEGIHKVALVVFEKNTLGNSFWEDLGFTVRNDLIYRNQQLSEIKRIDV